ncbi:MAG: hypothetical protein JNL58_17240 [Planctomyces sp.]|nr:hypothetical protein [Planctomyces sp.]
MLSPAEKLGLSGATLDNSVRRAVNHVSDPTLKRVSERLRSNAEANGVVYERDGVAEAVRIMLRPLLAMPEQINYVDHVCLKLAEALKQLPALYLEDADVRRILAITEDEEAWIRETWTPFHQKLNPVYGRLDAVCDFTAAGWQESLQFMEPNLSGVGGIHFAPLAEQLVMRDVIPTLQAHDPELEVSLPRDQRDLFVQVLIDHARALGRDSCQLCFVDPKYIHEGPDEQEVLCQFLAERHGLNIRHADPTELEVRGDEIYFGDLRVDVVYRDYDIRDLVDRERELGHRLEAMRLAFRQNRVVSSIVGDFDHKSCWELLTDEKLAERFFSDEERRLFRRHVLWTRVVCDRRTSLPHGKSGDLLEFARVYREQLVLKPNRGYGGAGVTIGAAATESEWDHLLQLAVKNANDPLTSWVVQAATRLPVHAFPVIAGNGQVFEEPFHAVMGFAPTENGLGMLCRVSQKQVVNVAQHGGLAAMLVAHPPSELRLRKRTLVASDGIEQTLRSQIVEIRHLDQTIGLLGWDEETMLPVAGRPQRGEQLATLEGLRHSLLVSDRLGDLIEEVAQQREDDERWMREITILRRLRRSSQALPDDLVRAFAKARSRALGAWEDARVRSDFSVFERPFERVVELARERADALARGSEPFDALLDEHEPGMTRSRLDPVLNELRDQLIPLVRTLSESTRQWATTLQGRRFSERGQWELARRMLTAIGFDFSRGRLDRSTHPFTLGAGAHDVRLTISVREDDFLRTILATMHEGGHGLYDQGFLTTDRDWMLGDAPGMGLHESQSRLWENHIGRSRAFWQFWFPALSELFATTVGDLNAETLYRALNVVQPCCNRVAADEVSYHLHILLRYELEQALLSGDLAVADLPQLWNERTTALLGVTPANDVEGVLQDVHWSLGMFGYFPTYTLGTLYAAQIVERYKEENPLEDEVRRGEFRPLLNWLRKMVHQPGYRMNAEELVTQVTGRGLDSSAFLRHLQRRFTSPQG